MISLWVLLWFMHPPTTLLETNCGLLSTINKNYIIPLCFMGDINTSLGVCEYRGHHSLSRFTMEDFQS